MKPFKQQNDRKLARKKAQSDCVLDVRLCLHRKKLKITNKRRMKNMNLLDPSSLCMRRFFPSLNIIFFLLLRGEHWKGVTLKRNARLK